MKKVVIATLFASAASISSVQASYTIEIEGETSANVTPKITVNKLTSSDAIQASDGVPDLHTPLGLSGIINYGLKGGNFNASANIQPTDSMLAIIGHFQNQYMPNGPIGYFPPVDLQGQPITISLPNSNIDFMLAKTSYEGLSQWGLSMHAQKHGQVLFLDVSQVTGFNNEVIFNGNMMPMQNNPGIAKLITSSIFPQSSGKTETDLMAQFTVDGLSNPLQSPTNSYTPDNGVVTFLFKSAVAS